MRALEVVTFVKRDPLLHDVLCRAVVHKAINPNTICQAVLSYVRLTPGIEAATRAADPPREIPGGDLFTLLIENALLADPEVERTLTRWRAAALRGAPADLPLLCAIAAQCFMTEYAYVETPDETRAVAELERSVAAGLAAGAEIAPALLAVLAAYRPLHRMPGADALTRRQLPPPLDRLVRRQVIEAHRGGKAASDDAGTDADPRRSLAHGARPVRGKPLSALEQRRADAPGDRRDRDDRHREVPTC